MDYRPPNPLLLLLLLISLLHIWQCARGKSLEPTAYIIDVVNLTIVSSGTVQSGTPVTLRCLVIVSHDNSLHLTNTFQFTRDDIPIHSYTTSKDTVLYELNPARAADSGNYECQVTVKDKSRRSSSQRLTVTGLQTPTLLLSKNELYENEDFMATCSAPEEKGDLTFRFHQKFRTGKHRLIKQTASTQNSSEAKLVLHQVGDSHLYCDYVIALVPDAGSSNRSNEIQVTVKVLYISPIMNVLPSLNVYEGDVIEVVCKVVNPPMNTEVFLTRDRRILQKAKVSFSHRFKVLEGDSGDLVCKAEWGNVQKETSKTITVKELFSKPHLTVKPIDLFEGDNFILTCTVFIYVPEKISNETIQLSIYKDNTKLINGNTYTAVAQPKENGNYTCKAQAASVSHSFVKESQTVVLKAKIPVSKPMMRVVGGTLVLGKSFQLICRSDSGTLPIKYTLHGPNREREVRIVRKPGQQAIFNTSAIYKSSDIDEFMCHAQNNGNRPPMVGQGQQLQNSTKIIEPVSEPFLTMQPNMGDISEGQDMTLVCTVQRGTPPITFTWHHTETEHALAFQNSEKLKGTYRIHNVKGEHKGTYYCMSTNQANETKRSRPVVIEVKMAGWKKGLISVFCILLLLALILVIFFKRHHLRFKRKRMGELSVKSASTKAERLSLTQAEVNEVANVTPGMIGKSVWSEHISGSESDDQHSVTAPEKPEPRYTEVQTRQVDPNRAPVKKGTDTVYSEVRNSKQGVPEKADGQGSVEYAQLNHDTDHHSDHGNHGSHSVQDDHLDEIDNSAVTDTADHGE
ncbi:platelet endothelial cell adhesion molecule isoform X1 [Thunnus maccoyii]|uniref:platelet endothelial cell adhesion molecule isoform X1 n=1 Tax=Thunnus maccoyii TaxID=8240 RepID=UPI001C4DD81C|nr:platelet endothelial cell adhesion molecule isoform X1 [Thunnus maccoyii]